MANIGGNLTLTTPGFASVGVTFGNDRVADAGAPGGFRVNQATGSLTIGGTLTVDVNNSFLSVGTTGGGVVDGTMRVGTLAMGANTFSAISVGLSGDGQATGRLEVGGGTLRTNGVNVGLAPANGTASGRIALTNANLQANTVVGGTGGGTAQMFFSNSQSTVAQNMLLLRGELGLERSLITVGNTFVLGDDALMHIEVDGLLRGAQYGAVDALAVALDGDLVLDFGDLVFGGVSADFDILRSGSANGITGDFDTFTFLNLLPGYSASAGIELDGGLEVYRVHLVRNGVPEPGTWLLLLVGLGAITRLRRRGAIGY